MTNEPDGATTWHRPTRQLRHALGVVVPVGPAHDPIDSVRQSDQAALCGGTPVVHVIIVNGEDPERRAESIHSRLAQLSDRVVLASIVGQVGYVRAVRVGLHLADSLGVRGDRIGFLDADARLLAHTHWQSAGALLDAEYDLDAVSGLVIHQHCQVWETLSSAGFVAAMEGVVGGPIHKPYLQGGAGGTLARREPFAQAVEDALRMETLIGPTLSATSIAAGRRVMATSMLPCGHTPRRTMQEWTDSVTAYERSWRGLIDLFGVDIEKPWREFLEFAEGTLKDHPKLLVNLRYNSLLRQQIVMRVHAERLQLNPGAAR